MNGRQLPQRRVIWLSLAWSWLAAIIYLSLTSVQVPTIVDWQDKAGHLFMYAIPMWWFLQLYPKKTHGMIALGLFLLGAALEFAQSFHPLRYMDYYDAIANAVGILAGWLSLFTPLSRLFISIENRWLAVTG